MTKILIPIPQTPLIDQRTLKMTREWYRYFSLLQQAVGGDTNIIIDGGLVMTPPDGSPIFADTGALDLGAPDAGQIEGLRHTISGLDPQIPGPIEFGQAFEVIARDTPFPAVPKEFGAAEEALARTIPFPMPPTELGGPSADTPYPMPPTELGSLEAAKNIGYRIVAAGNAVLVGGTVTVNSVDANSANEWSLTAKVIGGTQGILSVGTITANTSFVVNSSNAADTSTVSWLIFAPIKG